MPEREKLSGGQAGMALLWYNPCYLCPRATQQTPLPAFHVTAVFMTQSSPGLKGENRWIQQGPYDT